MSQPASVRVSVDVDLDPEAAFEVFTEEIDLWYRRGPHTFSSRKAVGMRFEPGVGGRLVEVHDAATGEGRTVGDVTVWEPGARLLFVDRRGTEVDVRFVAEGDGTRVTLEHRGLERLAPHAAVANARHGWRLLVPWFFDHVSNRKEPT